MTDYTELVKALRSLANGIWKNCEYTWFGGEEKVFADAAAAIEALQKDLTTLQKCYEIADTTVDKVAKQLPKRGEWILYGPVGWPKWKCSVCHSEGRGDYRRCPWCGAVMDESNALNALNALNNAQDGPIITPCRGCSDYDGYGGCKSKGGCARAKMEVQE